MTTFDVRGIRWNRGRLQRNAPGKPLPVESFGGKVKDMYALLGAYDLVFIVDLPGTQEAMKVSIVRGPPISFTSCLAMSVEHFDRLMAEERRSVVARRAASRRVGSTPR